MANPQLRLAENVPGAFYVDSTCIDCDTCRQLAPEPSVTKVTNHAFFISLSRTKRNFERSRRSWLV